MVCTSSRAARRAAAAAAVVAGRSTNVMPEADQKQPVRQWWRCFLLGLVAVALAAL